jgi:hypothetical protein
MNIVYRICLALALAGIAPAQPKSKSSTDTKATTSSKPRDVDGWGKIKWGMTLAEAKAACGTDCDEGTKLVVGEIKMTVTLSATGVYPDKYNATKPIAQIELSTVPGLDNRAESDVFEYLRSALIQKYGPITSEDRRPDELKVIEHRAIWVFPSTTITLKSREIRDGFLFLTYKMADKAKDVL